MENIIRSNIKIFESEEGLARNAAIDIASLLDETIKKRGTVTFVLSGGSTPKGIYQYMGNDLTGKVDWSKVYFFWGDERCVAPDDEDSNFKSANTELLSKIDVPGRNIFRIKGEMAPGQAAAEYEAELKKFFPGQKLPSFDLVLLGIGSDGHTASLFPGGRAITISDKWVTEDYIKNLKSWRITMTLPVLNNSRNVIFIAAGKEKSQILKKILSGEESEIPVNSIKPTGGNIYFYLDKYAAES